jgi:hypothetical protein
MRVENVFDTQNNKNGEERISEYDQQSVAKIPERHSFKQNRGQLIQRG